MCQGPVFLSLFVLSPDARKAASGNCSLFGLQKDLQIMFRRARADRWLPSLRCRHCCRVRATALMFDHFSTDKGIEGRRIQNTQKGYHWAKQTGLAKKVPPHLLQGASSIFLPEKNLGVQAVLPRAGPGATMAMAG